MTHARTHTDTYTYINTPVVSPAVWVNAWLTGTAELNHVDILSLKQVQNNDSACPAPTPHQTATSAHFADRTYTHTQAGVHKHTHHCPNILLSTWRVPSASSLHTHLQTNTHWVSSCSPPLVNKGEQELIWLSWQQRARWRGTVRPDGLS